MSPLALPYLCLHRHLRLLGYTENLNAGKHLTKITEVK